ncbi:hypothetical protein Q9966_016474 [Columba livia]|nr:hypothetical protein Q9966_016474 [Columba livia]
MMYMFLGVSIIADRFMASIEVITSKEKEITITKANGETSVGTVPHLERDAAESRKIKHLRVFFVTASWSIFAYVWLYLILAVISPGVVQVWEALLTLVFFPVCVVFAWAADKRLLFYKYVYKRYRADPRRGVIIGTEAEPPKGAGADGGAAPPPSAARPTAPSSPRRRRPGAEEKELDESRREGAEPNHTFYVDYRTEDGSAKAGSDYEYSEGTLVFKPGETQKELTIGIIDDDIFEGGRALLRAAGSTCDGDGDRALSAEEEEARRIAEMGKPVLGENCKLEVIIAESYDFKNTVDKLIKKTNLATVIGTHSWREQFLEAITVSAGEEEEEEEGREERLPSCFDYVMHFLTVFWKVLFACVPPTAYCSGWACFGVSILLLALLTALIGDLAAHFGCTVGLKDSVNAVVFVALGTSIPDTFASKVAALQDACADASIGNVTGSNAVNVFLGLGVAWSVAAIYWAAQGRAFRVPAGTLAFSVTLFTAFAFVGVTVLLYRRRPHIGGELGGPRTPKLLTAGLFLALWLLYVLFASLEAYCHIRGF